MRSAFKLTIQLFIFSLAGIISNAQASDYHAHGKHRLAHIKPPGPSAFDNVSPSDTIVKYTWLASSVHANIDAKPTKIEKEARIHQTWLQQINLPYENQLKNLDARNILIGVADTVLETTHPQFLNKTKHSYNGYDGSSNIIATPTSTHHVDHATPVASAALGKLVMITGKIEKPLQGVAPGASLAMAKVFNDQPGEAWSWDAFTKSINWLATTVKVPIVNLSLGGNSLFTHEALAALRNSIAKGTLFVIASGNEGQTQSAWPAAYANAVWAKEQIIAVGSVDKKNQLSYFSNAAGAIAPWFVVAPGEDITLGSVGKTYMQGNGTSFAAPIVAGQAALIKSRWPHLSAATTAKIIFQTATHLGDTPEDVPDPLYGWGLINIGKSLEPIGILEVELANGSKIPVSVLSLGTIQGAIGAALRVAAASGKFLMGGATDVYNRQYSVDPGIALPPKPFTLSLKQMTNEVDRQSKFADVPLDEQGSRFRYFMHQRTKRSSGSDLLASRDNDNLNSAGLVKRFANGNEFSAAMGGENIYMGLADYRIEGAPELSGTGFNNAYLALVPSASSFGVGRKFANGIKVKFGLVNTHFAQTMLNQSAPNFILQNSSSQQIAAVDMKTIEVSKQYRNSILGFGFSGVGEQNMLLGTKLGNGFNLNKPAKTRVLTLNMAHKLSSNLVMAGYISHGITAGYDNPHSLVSAVSTTYSKAYGVGFSMNNVQRKADRFTVNLSSPLATTSGSMTLDLPSDVDINGNLVRTQRQISLASPAREYRTEITYFTPLSKTTALSINITHRQNANHMARETEQIAMMNYHISFD